MLNFNIYLLYGVLVGISICYFLKGTGIYTLNTLLLSFVIYYYKNIRLFKMFKYPAIYFITIF